MAQCTFRVIGGPIPKDVRVSVKCRTEDLVATVLANADDALKEQLLLRGTASGMWSEGPVVHASSFDLLQLSVVGGGQGKVVAMLDPDTKVSRYVKGGPTETETILLLRPRSMLPPGIPRGPQQKVLRLTRPLVVQKPPTPKPPTPPPPKPDLALRVVGGPIPKDVRIVLKVFRTTMFMDMFPLIHDKVELVVPLAVVSARYYNLYEFEIVQHGKGKKRRALFAKDTPASIGLISNVLMLEEKPLWQHMPKPAELHDDDESEASDNLSDIRPPSPTSTLRDRDTDTPPGTVGLQVDDGVEEPGWWEGHAEGGHLTAEALKLRATNLEGLDNLAVGRTILDLVSPQNQQAQLVRVVGKSIPRTARVIIDILRTQTFISFFPLIQAKVVEFLPNAHITPYRFELVEMELLPQGKTRAIRTLKLEQTPWTCDFGLASVILLREIPQGFLKGVDDEPTLEYASESGERPQPTYGPLASKPGTAASVQSSSTIAATRVHTAPELEASSPQRYPETASVVRAHQHVERPGHTNEAQVAPHPHVAPAFDGNFDVDAMELIPEEAAHDDASPEDDAVRHVAPCTPTLENPPSSQFASDDAARGTAVHDDTAPANTAPSELNDEQEEHLAAVAAYLQVSAQLAVDEIEVLDEEPPVEAVGQALADTTSLNTSDGHRGIANQYQGSFSSPNRLDASNVVDINDDEEAETEASPNLPARAPSVATLLPLRTSSKYSLYQEQSVVEDNPSVLQRTASSFLPPAPPPPDAMHPNSTLQEELEDAQRADDAEVHRNQHGPCAPRGVPTVLSANPLRCLASSVSFEASVRPAPTWDSDEDDG